MRRIRAPTPSSRLLIRLVTWRWIIAALLRSSRCLGRQPVGLGQGAHGVVDRRDRLLLHGEDARELLAQLALRVVELASRVFLGDDPQADLAALADVRPLDRVEIAGVGVEGDDGPDGELERGQLPFVGDLLVLDEARSARAVPCSWAVQRGMATSACGSDSPVASR